MSYHFDTVEELKEFISREVMTNSEASAYLGISRQGFAKQLKKNRIIAIREGLYLKKDLDYYSNNLKKTGRPKKQEEYT